MHRFIADENIPSRVVRGLRGAGYEVITVAEAASAEVKNDQLAELSARIGHIILTRDADFTSLKLSVMRSVRISIYEREETLVNSLSWF